MPQSIKLKSGTVLPLTLLKGKDYLNVCYRIVWFREERPDWSIETEFLTQTDQSAICKATIKDASGRIMATSHKEESSKDFAFGHREKAETGSIGRALALCGYGTQFEPEFDEGDRVVDSPLKILPKGFVEPGNGHQKEGYVFPGHAGPTMANKHIDHVPTEVLRGFVEAIDTKYKGKVVPVVTKSMRDTAFNEILEREGVKLPGDFNNFED